MNTVLLFSECYTMTVTKCSKTINSYFYNHSCCKNGFAMGSMPSTGQTNTTAVPRHTARPICLVSSVSLNGSSGSASYRKNNTC